MSKTNIHIVPRDGNWAVVREGAERDSSHHGTQSSAIDAGRDTARKEGVEIIIHRPNGQIRQRDSYGNDPFPPKG